MDSDTARHIWEIKNWLIKGSKCIDFGLYKVNPNHIICWKYKDDTRAVNITLTSGKTEFILPNEEEYIRVKSELDNYNF